MWKLPKEKVRLHELVYIPDPRDGYRYVLLRPTFRTDAAADTRHWDNNALQSGDSVKALVVLTAWLVSYAEGFATYMRTTWRDDGRIEVSLYFQRDSNPYDAPSHRVLRHDRLPPYIQEALGTLKRELERAYGSDDRLDT